MGTIPPHPRLKDAANAATFIALVQDNFEVLAAEVAKREPTYANGTLTTILGGLSEGEAMSLSVNGFVNDLVREFPMEYSVELKRLIDMEMEGSVG